MPEAVVAQNVLVGKTGLILWTPRRGRGWRGCGARGRIRRGGSFGTLGKGGGGLNEKGGVEEREVCFGGLEGIAVCGQGGRGEGGEEAEDGGRG